MPKDAARRIEAATGCLAASLMDKKSSPLRLDSEPYTRRSYTNYQEASTAKPESVEAAAADLQFRVRTLLAAADSKFLYAARRLSDAIDEVLKETGISLDTLESVERKTASVSVSEMTITQLRKDVAAAPLLEWLDAHPELATSKCKVVDECYQHWPITDFEDRITYARKIQRHRYRIEFADGRRYEVVKDSGRAKGVSGKGTPHPEEGGALATVPTPGFSKPRKRSSRIKISNHFFARSGATSLKSMASAPRSIWMSSSSK